MPAPLEIDRSIRYAIRERRLIRLAYSGRTRIAEPHDYGLIDHEARLLAWQRREEGSTRPPGWRLFGVATITRVDVLEESFTGSRDAGQPHRFAWDPLIIRVR